MSTSSPLWKDKYSRLPDDYERLERHTTQRAQLLERGLVRSSLAAEGQDRRLDQHLQTLRDSMRNSDSKQLAYAVDDLERYLLATDHQHLERQEVLCTALDAIISQLLASCQERHSRQTLKKLQATLSDCQLQQDVQQTHDLTKLKQRVDQHLQQFVRTLEQHQLQRKNSEEQLLQHLHELSERVHLVENEASQLTSQLVEQHEKARRDALTCLPNRAAWDERLQDSLLLAVLDVDHFKRINDRYGHQAGDKVLKVLAGRLQQSIRKTDFIARYGGEEFVLLLPDTELDAGIHLLNTLREYIANCPFHFKGEPVQITFSADIGQLQSHEDPAATFALIDQALYTAKQGGRNQIKSVAVAEL